MLLLPNQLVLVTTEFLLSSSCYRNISRHGKLAVNDMCFPDPCFSTSCTYGQTFWRFAVVCEYWLAAEFWEGLFVFSKVAAFQGACKMRNIP